MTAQEIKQYAASVIRAELVASGIEARKIILFGSQASGTAGKDSDWDFLVCVPEELPFSKRAKIATRIQRKLAVSHIPADLIIKSEASVDRERNNVGVITHYALKNGIQL
ncbi:MAG: nucleotidyltransferase domain-containing protein [Elusimicrobiota bacterium]|nr:nucleotidyltransferase domain-containing protein [Elusimicrobiota bacterium]